MAINESKRQVAQCATSGTVCERKVLPVKTNDVVRHYSVRSAYRATVFTDPLFFVLCTIS